ncbi:hypothetical protein D3C72_1914780 [compost metagenome]
MPARIAVIDADEDAILHLAANLDDPHARLLERRVADLLAARHVHAVQQEILVAALVLDEQQGLRIGRPEAAADGPHLFFRQRTRLRQVIGRRHPHIEHAIARRDPRQPLPIGTELATGLAGITEQLGPLDQRRFLDRGLGVRRQCAGEQQDRQDIANHGHLMVVG